MNRAVVDLAVGLNNANTVDEYLARPVDGNVSGFFGQIGNCFAVGIGNFGLAL